MSGACTPKSRRPCTNTYCSHRRPAWWRPGCTSSGMPSRCTTICLRSKRTCCIRRRTEPPRRQRIRSPASPAEARPCERSRRRQPPRTSRKEGTTEKSAPCDLVEDSSAEGVPPALDRKNRDPAPRSVISLTRSSPAHMAQGACVFLRDFDPDPHPTAADAPPERVVWERIGAWPPGDLCRSSHLCG
jgi:hypothetical protein